jgi:Fe-S-cluster-containing dehydrogenase component
MGTERARHSGPAAWPEIVWDAPMLRGLDARARGEIEAAGALRRLRAGATLFSPGDPADAIHVVASGAVSLSGVRRGEAGAAEIRRATPGEVLGEEAIVAALSTRQLEARAETDAVVAEVPLVVLKRAIGRAGGAELMAKIERALRRAATLDLLRTSSFTRALSDADLELLLDAARHVHVARGEHVYREGDAATDAFLVADGLLQAQSDDDGKPRVEAYLSRGDLFGDEELAEREARAVSVVACGPTWLVALPRDVFVSVARRNGTELEAARRLRSEVAAAERRARPCALTTAHVFRDLYRLRVARSLLVIDQDACIRCGHCAWSCAQAHEDGVSRLVRRGDKIVVSAGAPEATAPMLVPNSCQHCKNPSCMIDCPTGAIGRDARGEIFIREELCTGCGSCAKACPWENIQMAPRRDASAYPAVAVKCDLCAGIAGGPACVASCPAQAIARIDPSAVLVELRAPGMAPREVLPPRAPAWPWVLGATLASAGLATLPSLRGGRWESGVLAGALVSLLVAYAIGKRARRPLAKLGAKLPLARALYVAHLSAGVLACGAIAAHVRGAVPPNVAGALTLALALAVVTGVVGASIGAVVPRALSRVERSSVLPEELATKAKEIDEKIFAMLSGKSELTKTLFVEALRPYRRSLLGPLLLLVSRRSLRREEKALRARVDALAKARGGTREALAGLDDLVRLVVEHRAVRLQRLLTWILRGWLAPHLAATAAALVLLVLHVVSTLGGAR